MESSAKESDPILNAASDKVEDLRLYKRRWLYLAVLVVLQAINSFNFSGFGQASSVYVVYFDVSYFIIDWITIGSFLGVCIGSPFLAFLCFTDLTSFRRLSIAGALCVTVAFACTFISVTVAKTEVFPLMVFGQISNGIAGAIMVSIPAIFAALWFPENQVGTAIGANMFGISVGGTLGFILPVNILKTPYSFHNSSAINSSLVTNNSQKITEDHFILMIMYICLLVVSCIVLLLILIFFQDLPPQPPTHAQFLNRQNNERNIESVQLSSLKDFLLKSKELFIDKTYMLSALALGIIFHTSTIEFTLMDQITSIILSLEQPNKESNVTSGYVMAVYSIGGAIGSLISGKLMNHCKRLKLQAIIGTLLTFISSIGIVVSYVWRQSVGLFISNAAYGFCVRIGIMPFMDILIQHTYPRKESFVSMWGTGIQTSIGVIAAEVGRVLFQFTSGLGALSFQSSVLFLAFVICWFIKPDYKRLEVNK